ncbi:hypothetical protein M427DRAFT_51962 [Gonapodya prolifera JEL478]|uniref:N-acetyltransferase domain-containing protein n=1 Tax=Gonapodya prolifera (strain JEL478) TaxID=1344416 RepID=A0A139AWA7_GONPJ|nr:hypothetical protein M427DRAFT_51962 [Gonapodya prolifera JEL478]|eukprot:KXS21022.1 hypothetical protein M427DRAFT_51962 [Gonapodya prolifera JEL478]
MGVQNLAVDWLERTLRFLEDGRRNLNLAGFVAEVEDGTKHTIVASAVCQVFAGPYPTIIDPVDRRDGYVWGVYVHPDYRRRGHAGRLVELCAGHLKDVGCTQALLNAAPMGKALYAKMGFEESNAMKLDLKKWQKRE